MSQHCKKDNINVGVHIRMNKKIKHVHRTQYLVWFGQFHAYIYGQCQPKSIINNINYKNSSKPHKKKTSTLAQTSQMHQNLS